MSQNEYTRFPTMEHSPSLRQVCDYFATITRDTAQRAGRLYAPDAYFKDPFNEVHGNAAIQRLFVRMFDQVDQPRFIIHEAILQGDQAFITWDMAFRFKRGKRGEQRIRGVSHLRFAADGRIASHRDYWDTAEELYEKLPGVRVLMRVLRRFAA